MFLQVFGFRDKKKQIFWKVAQTFGVAVSASVRLTYAGLQIPGRLACVYRRQRQTFDRHADSRVPGTLVHRSAPSNRFNLRDELIRFDPFFRFSPSDLPHAFRQFDKLPLTRKTGRYWRATGNYSYNSIGDDGLRSRAAKLGNRRRICFRR